MPVVTSAVWPSVDVLAMSIKPEGNQQQGCRTFATECLILGKIQEKQVRNGFEYQVGQETNSVVRIL